MPSKKPWGGRFSESTDKAVEAFTSSIDTDAHIAEDDVQGSIAHALMLAEVGLISREDGDAIVAGLEEIAVELSEGTFPWDSALEDVHMNVEHRLGSKIGTEIAGRLHTARSRNDQVALDSRLYLRRRLSGIREGIIQLERALIAQAEKHVDTLLPGYTHLQRAQPVRLAHHLLAYREMFARDRERVEDCLKRVTVSPLGAGALAATTHPIDRDFVSRHLGFNGVTANSLDTVADRDTFLESMSAASISMVHLSRICEELVMWSAYEFGFCEIGDAFTTGSSMMPQKKNPDVAELVRGKCGRVIGDLVTLLVTMKGLPLAYNRDMQEDKPALVDCIDTWDSSVHVMAKMIPVIDFKAERMRSALDDGFVTATELADHLVQQGVPFRECHHVVGKIVASCIENKRRLDQLSVDEYRSFHPSFADDVLNWVDPEVAVERRNIPGGPAKSQVLNAIGQAKLELDNA